MMWFLIVVEHSGVCYDSGHGFEQCDFTNSPMSEYGPMGENRSASFFLFIIIIHLYFIDKICCNKKA